MELYTHDCSYLFTEYARQKDIECYDIEAREKENSHIPGSGTPDNNFPDEEEDDVV